MENKPAADRLYRLPELPQHKSNPITPELALIAKSDNKPTKPMKLLEHHLPEASSVALLEAF